MSQITLQKQSQKDHNNSCFPFFARVKYPWTTVDYRRDPCRKMNMAWVPDIMRNQDLEKVFEESTRSEINW